MAKFDAKPSPGPWSTHQGTGIVTAVNAKGETFQVAITKGTLRPADFKGRPYHFEIEDANARLIAASPDLLSVAKQIVADFEGTPYDESGKLDVVRQAIAKAEVGA